MGCFFVVVVAFSYYSWGSQYKKAIVYFLYIYILYITTQNEIVGWHHRLSGHEFQQTLGDAEGRGSLACCSPWGCKESDTTEGLNNSNKCSFS